MYRILVAVDGSEPSLRAARYAAQRARASDCRVALLHVEKAVMAWEVGPLASGDAVESLHGAASARVIGECACAFDASSDVARHVVVGDPADIILEQANKLGADEIVLGSRGINPFGAAWLGSVAYKVLHHASVPVVVVR